MRLRIASLALLIASAAFAQTPNLDQLKKDAIAGVDALTDGTLIIHALAAFLRKLQAPP